MKGATIKNALKRLLICIFVSMMLPVMAFASQTGKVNCNSLNLRESASKSSKTIQTLSKGDKVTIGKTSGDWYKVTYGKYTGYVQRKYITVTSGSSSSKTTGSAKASKTSTSTAKQTKAAQIAALGAAPSPSKPGDSGSKVKKLKKALKIMGYFNGTVDGSYGDSTKKAVKKYQKSVGLSADGIAGANTIAWLFNTNRKSSSTTDSAKGLPTESLDWFKKGSKTIPKKATVTIKDCKTGRTFKAKRWSGANHADMEPLTAEDTRILLSIYGNWSWTRRSVLVYYKGHVYAGSINGMPHGTATIDTNDFEGHFCLHFTGSKTHGTKRVDTTHQNCVQNALKSKW